LSATLQASAQQNDAGTEDQSFLAAEVVTGKGTKRKRYELPDILYRIQA
jgi:hypothetical protein